MYNFFINFLNLLNNDEIQRLKHENNVLKYKLEGTIIAKNDIYKKYQNLIIKQSF
tara:strand:- start:341 stop:505 length:165 start_codon:yes stop_codon:yes gene_type:complete